MDGKLYTARQAVVLGDKERGKMLLEIVKRDNDGHGTAGVDWKKVWEGYTAGLDGPFTDYYYETYLAFPESKVILTTRD